MTDEPLPSADQLTLDTPRTPALSKLFQAATKSGYSGQGATPTSKILPDSLIAAI